MHEAYIESWHDAIKKATDEWLTINMRMIGAWCLETQRRYRLNDVWEDLRGDCIIAAYRYAARWQPEGSFNNYLYFCIKRHPSRRDVIAKYVRNVGQELQDIPAQEILTTNDEPSAITMIEGLPVAERQYLTMKYLGNLNNCEMARIIGVSECTVRYQLNRILNKIKVKGDGTS